MLENCFFPNLVLVCRALPSLFSTLSEHLSHMHEVTNVMCNLTAVSPPSSPAACSGSLAGEIPMGKGCVGLPADLAAEPLSPFVAGGSTAE